MSSSCVRIFHIYTQVLLASIMNAISASPIDRNTKGRVEQIGAGTWSD
ncbi:MAG TPA: hypothetical protein VMW53_12875 [archaeon]|nr:hypothetical protein [archaeon]